MNLNQEHRTQFVYAVMASVPKKHHTTKELLAAEMSAEFTKLVPSDLARVVKKYSAHLSNKYGSFLLMSKDHEHAERDILSQRTCDARISVAYPSFMDEKAVDPTPYIKRWEAHRKEQVERSALAERLRQVANGCRTLKQLQEALPELVDYMPKPEARTALALTGASNLVTDLMKAGAKIKKAK